MKYFKNSLGEVFGYDETDPTQESLIEAAVSVGWEDVSSIWPPAPVPPKVTQVSPRQFRLALNQAGLRQTVETAVASADQDTKDTWEFATQVDRGDPALNAMAASLGITDAQLDDLFTLAATK